MNNIKMNNTHSRLKTMNLLSALTTYQFISLLLILPTSYALTSCSHKKKSIAAFPRNQQICHRKKSNIYSRSGGTHTTSGIYALNTLDEESESIRVSLQRNLQYQTLSRIIVPSIAIASVGYLSFSPITRGLATAIHDIFDGTETGYGYETLNLILTDNSNQFIQNVHNALALIFTFLTGNTLFFMYRQQETLYFALFEEVTALTSLLEQSALISEGRELYRTLLNSIYRYVEYDLKLVTDFKTIQGQDKSTVFSYLLEEMELPREDLPALLLSRRPKDDPLETILYVTSVGEPSAIYQTVRELRRARAKRLGALQRKMPEVNMYLLYVLGFFVWISFPIVATGSQTVGGPVLLDVFRTQLSMGIFAMCFLLGIINELKRPEIGSAYNIDYELLGTLVDGIEKDLSARIKVCEEINTATVSTPSKVAKEKRLFARTRRRFRKLRSRKS